MTREEAVLKIMNLELRVDLVLQNRLLEFRRVLASTGTDHGVCVCVRARVCTVVYSVVIYCGILCSYIL